MINNISITGFQLRSIFVYISGMFYAILWIKYRVGVNSIVVDQYNSVPNYSFLRDGE